MKIVIFFFCNVFSFSSFRLKTGSKTYFLTLNQTNQSNIKDKKKKDKSLKRKLPAVNELVLKGSTVSTVFLTFLKFFLRVEKKKKKKRKNNFFKKNLANHKGFQAGRRIR